MDDGISVIIIIAIFEWRESRLDPGRPPAIYPQIQSYTSTRVGQRHL